MKGWTKEYRGWPVVAFFLVPWLVGCVVLALTLVRGLADLL